MAPTFLQVSLGLSAVFTALSAVRAETHTVTFDNQCGTGTPTLILGGKIVSTGQPYTANGVINGIAYLQTGPCLFNGENCPLLEMNLANPTCPGCGSSTDISLIPPHAYTVETSFSYYNGCDNQGATCDSPNCNTAFFQPNDNQVQVQCEVDNVNLLITFCGDATKGNPGSPAPVSSPAPAKPTTTPAAKPTTSAAAPSKPTTSAAASPVTTSKTVAPVPTTTDDVSSSLALPTTVLNVGGAPPAASSSVSTDAASISTEAAATGTVVVSAASPTSTSTTGRCNKSKKRRSLLEREAIAAGRRAHRAHSH